MHRLRSYNLSASYADPKPWMEFSGKDTGSGGRMPSLFHNLSICESDLYRNLIVVLCSLPSTADDACYSGIRRGGRPDVLRTKLH